LIFKTKEEMLQKGENLSDAQYHYNCGVEGAFFRFKERIEFYRTYHFRRTAFYEDYPDKHKEFMNIYVCAVNTSKEEPKLQAIWELWIFDFCFGDICK
jgi:hypothetical protein